MVYCATSLSLATLEYFVHCDPYDLPTDLVMIRVELPDTTRTERWEVGSLPRDWRNYPGIEELKDMGSEWSSSLRTVALLVPSAVTPIEDNVLVNPKHPDIATLTVHAADPFSFDPRMGG